MNRPAVTRPTSVVLRQALVVVANRPILRRSACRVTALRQPRRPRCVAVQLFALPVGTALGWPLDVALRLPGRSSGPCACRSVLRLIWVNCRDPRPMRVVTRCRALHRPQSRKLAASGSCCSSRHGPCSQFWIQSLGCSRRLSQRMSIPWSRVDQTSQVLSSALHRRRPPDSSKRYQLQGAPAAGELHCPDFGLRTGLSQGECRARWCHRPRPVALRRRCLWRLVALGAVIPVWKKRPSGAAWMAVL
mmetsp:Transcript_15201/g.36640  ORF Transcript_15201/g.36640 Transcript_15201/m.36640 type:complete len:247 (+) Transcript_15201:73-813(+)